MAKSTITREQLIKKAQEQIEFCRHTKITGEGRAHVNQCAALFEIALAAMDSEPAIADCDPEVYEKGVSVCLVAIPKETAEVICQNITAATGCKVDWHYFGGRVHIKALRESSQSAPVVQMVPEEPPEHRLPKGNSRDTTYRRGAIILCWKLCRAAMLAASPQEIKS